MPTSHVSMTKIRHGAAALTEKLNEMSEQVARRETELQKVNVPVPFWWGRRWFGERKYLAKNGVTVSEYWQMGYVRIADQRRIAVQCIRAEGDDAEDPVTIQGPVPLSTAPPEVRVEACEYLDEFLAAMATTLERVVKRLDEAVRCAEAR